MRRGASGKQRKRPLFRKSICGARAGTRLVPGLQAEYWDNTDLSGYAHVQRVEKELQVNWTLFSPDSGHFPRLVLRAMDG